jgi:hypothetical protein
MNQAMYRYKVKPGEAEQNEALVRAVFEELHQTAPAGLSYATFVLQDGVSFVHLVENEADGPSPLLDVAAFQAFQDNLDERVDGAPVRDELRLVGVYGFNAQ